MQMNGLMGGLYRLCEWIMRISAINLLWALCSFPIFFLLLQLLLIENLEEMMAILLLMAVIAPFLLFPSTSAMFSVVRKWVLGEVDVPLLKTFFKSYKQNYVQSMFGGIIFMALAVLLIINFRFYSNVESSFSILSGVFIAFLIILFISVINFHNLLAHMHMKTWHIVKNAIFLTIGKPLTTLMIVLTAFVIIYLSATYLNFFLFFVATGTVIAYMSFFYFHRAMHKIQEKHEKEIAKNEEQQEQKLE